MKLEQSDSSMLFSYTSLPDVFFTEYLSMANGNYVKVYLTKENTAVLNPLHFLNFLKTVTLKKILLI